MLRFADALGETGHERKENAEPLAWASLKTNLAFVFVHSDTCTVKSRQWRWGKLIVVTRWWSQPGTTVNYYVSIQQIFQNLLRWLPPRANGGERAP